MVTLALLSNTFYNKATPSLKAWDSAALSGRLGGVVWGEVAYLGDCGQKRGWGIVWRYQYPQHPHAFVLSVIKHWFVNMPSFPMRTWEPQTALMTIPLGALTSKDQHKHSYLFPLIYFSQNSIPKETTVTHAITGPLQWQMALGYL